MSYKPDESVLMACLYDELSGEERVLVERSEEHTSELQSLAYIVCRLLLEKKKNSRPLNVSVTYCAETHPCQTIPSAAVNATNNHSGIGGAFTPSEVTVVFSNTINSEPPGTSASDSPFTEGVRRSCRFELGSTVTVSFFFNDPPTTEIYTLSLHDALPILRPDREPHHRGEEPRHLRGAGHGAPAPRLRALGHGHPQRGHHRAVPRERPAPRPAAVSGTVEIGRAHV